MTGVSDYISKWNDGFSDHVGGTKKVLTVPDDLVEPTALKRGNPRTTAPKKTTKTAAKKPTPKKGK